MKEVIDGCARGRIETLRAEVNMLGNRLHQHELDGWVKDQDIRIAVMKIVEVGEKLNALAEKLGMKFDVQPAQDSKIIVERVDG
jgi:hypothetical protein